MFVRLIPLFLALSLLSTRVVLQRRLHPAAYTLYMDLLSCHAFSLHIHFPNYHKVMALIHHFLHFSQLYSSHDTQHGVVLVHFLFNLVS